MPTFFLIDHSIDGTGGHHFQYALHVLRAAEQAGYRIALATNHRFRAANTLPNSWRIHALFRHDTYNSHCLYFDKSYRTRQGTTSRTSPAIARLRGATAGWRSWRRRRRVRHFARACERFFQREPLAEGDHVLLPTMSEFDLEGLVEYLAATPSTRRADWHVQFHYDLFTGRPPEYARQAERMEAMRGSLLESDNRAAQHRFHYYATTEQLMAQYELTGSVRWEALPYPVNPAIAPPDALQDEQDRGGAPLRATCAGYFRREKGRQHLIDLAGELKSELLDSGKVRLILQGKAAQLRRMLARQVAGGSRRIQSAVEIVPHPLEVEKYVDLICRANVGLFLYDSRNYYVRCSGILVEMLAAGVPVIVPAGCWLAEQIAECNQRHLDRLAEEAQVIGTQHFPRLAFGCPAAAAQRELAVPAAAAGIIASLRWISPTQVGTYVCLQAEQYDPAGRKLSTIAETHGHRAGDRPVAVSFPLADGAARVQLSWWNAYDQSDITAGDVHVKFLGGAHDGRNHPTGCVGLIAADRDQVPRLLGEIVEHYQHYRAAARQFAETWRRDHDPQRIVQQLVANGQQPSRNRGEPVAA